jgi:hypothetical protein
MPFSAKIVGDELVLRIPLNPKPERSSSGKTLVVASTYGNKETDCVVDGTVSGSRSSTATCRAIFGVSSTCCDIAPGRPSHWSDSP